MSERASRPGPSSLVALRAAARRTVLGADDPQAAADAAADVLVPTLGEWCELRADTDAWAAVRGSRGGLDPEALADVERARLDARREAETVVCGTGSSIVIVAPVTGGDGVVGTLALAPGTTGDVDALAATVEQVADLVGAVVERAQLRSRTRDAARHAQRVASQLHQLLAASIAVRGLQGEDDILASVTQRVRAVFDGDVAVAATSEQGPDAGCFVCEQGERATRLALRQAVTRYGIPAGATALAAAGVEDRWLLAPLLARRAEPLGWLAVRRDAAAFDDDDIEVVTLLAQTAASALASARLNRSVARNEARLRALVDAAPVAIVEHDADGRVRWWNRAAAACFSWDDAGTDGEPAFPEHLVEALAPLWSDAAAGASVVGQELAGVELGAGTRHLTVGVVPLPASEDRPDSLLTVAEDVTDHRQLMEELRHAQRMEVIGQLSSSVAHDFNNLLMLIAGYAELLVGELPEDATRPRGIVGDIQATTSRASTLTGKLLTMGRTKLPTPVVFSPAEALRGIAEVLDRIVGADVLLDLSLDEATPTVRADPDQFEQTVMNLATNARDAMPDGGTLTITLRPGTTEAGEHVAHLTIADTGVGMDEATLARCFEPLFTTKGPSRGTGLGLPAARRVVTEAGGTITCVSEPGKGTTFEIELPASQGEQLERREEVVAPSGARSGSVLLVEDEAGIRELVERVLTRGGFDVLTASSGDEAVALAAELDGPVDLLVSDVVMPGMSGQQLAHVLQERWPGLLVVLMSGNIDASAIAELREGSAAFLAKPFRPSAVLGVADELLARAAAR